MQNIFPEYKSEIVLGNGKFQLDPMSYTVIYEGKEISLAPRVNFSNQICQCRI